MKILKPFSSIIGSTYVREKHETILKGEIEFHKAGATSLIIPAASIPSPVGSISG